MLAALPDILTRIVGHKRLEVAQARELRPSWESEAALSVAQRRDFAAALRAKPPAIIAEIKRASPSKGLLVEDFQPAGIAAAYQAGGADALSVLTDEHFFRGSLADLAAARAAAPLPVLRKDFTLDSYQVEEAAAHGADAVLLLAAVLTTAELRAFRELAASYAMAALVEVHDGEELDRALESGAEIVGVNNRDLRTFEVSLDTSLRLASRMPAGILKVSESGIHGAAGVHLLQSAGYQAFLVGEHLMKAADPAAALRALRP